MNISELGFNIKVERVRNKLTQAQLAELVDMSVNSITAIENGKQIPNAMNIYRIAKVLKVDLIALYKNVDV